MLVFTDDVMLWTNNAKHLGNVVTSNGKILKERKYIPVKCQHNEHTHVYIK